MIKMAICDDLSTDRGETISFIKKYLCQKYIDVEICEFEDGLDLLDEYQNAHAVYDVIFLDIFMKHSNGVEVAKHIREFDQKVLLCFTTSSSDFALSGYDVQAIGYLVKPLDSEKTTQLLDHIMERLNRLGDQTIVLSTKTRQIKLFFGEIEYIESDNSSVFFYTDKGTSFRLYMKLKDVEDLLPKSIFIRCHQSFIVNMNFIKSASSEFVLKSGEIIPIRRQDIKRMRDTYSEFLLAKK